MARESYFGLVYFILLSIVLFSILFVTPKFIGMLTAEVYVNRAPAFNVSRPIANQSFQEDASIENAFNLPFNFFDLEGDNLTLKMFGNTSTYAEVNSTTQNVTIKATPNFNGLETVYFVAEDSRGLNTTSNTITINITPVTDFYWHYSGSNFSLYNYSYPVNLSFYNPFGFLNFTYDVLNFSTKFFSGVDINFTQFINISFNRIFLNSTGLSEINQSATLTLSDLTFTNPRLLRDSSICPSTICTKTSYSGGTLIFNVTGFSEYKAEETPGVSDGSGSSAGGGGGGGGTGRAITGAATEAFSLDKESINVKLKQGETKRTTLRIKNDGTATIGLNVDLSDLGNFLVFTEIVSTSTVKVTLQPQEEAILQLVLQADDEIAPGSYLKKIKIRSASKELEILVLIDVTSKEALFDVDVVIPQNYRELEPGDILTAQIIIFNIRPTARVDVDVQFELKHIDGSLLLASNKFVAVETTTSFIETFQIPRDAKKGNYILNVKTIYEDKTASASELFRVIEKSYLGFSKDFLTIFLFSLGALVLVVMFFFVFLGVFHIKRETSKEAIKERHAMHIEVEEIFDMLSQARRLLKDGYYEEARRLYRRIKLRYDSLPIVAKREVYDEAYELAVMLKKRVSMQELI